MPTRCSSLVAKEQTQTIHVVSRQRRANNIVDACLCSAAPGAASPRDNSILSTAVVRHAQRSVRMISARRCQLLDRKTKRSGERKRLRSDDATRRRWCGRCVLMTAQLPEKKRGQKSTQPRKKCLSLGLSLESECKLKLRNKKCRLPQATESSAAMDTCWTHLMSFPCRSGSGRVPLRRWFCGNERCACSAHLVGVALAAIGATTRVCRTTPAVVANRNVKKLEKQVEFDAWASSAHTVR